MTRYTLGSGSGVQAPWHHVLASQGRLNSTPTDVSLNTLVGASLLPQGLRLKDSGVLLHHAALFQQAHKHGQALRHRPSAPHQPGAQKPEG